MALTDSGSFESEMEQRPPGVQVQHCVAVAAYKRNH